MKRLSDLLHEDLRTLLGRYSPSELVDHITYYEYDTVEITLYFDTNSELLIYGSHDIIGALKYYTESSTARSDLENWLFEMLCMELYTTINNAEVTCLYNDCVKREYFDNYEYELEDCCLLIDDMFSFIREKV